jgi:hypothetical protein
MPLAEPLRRAHHWVNPPRMSRLCIPAKPATYSDVKPAHADQPEAGHRTDLKPARIPI